MRILHSSDWHLGISSGTTSRAPDHERFFDWLLQQLELLEIDALLVAGDVFDSMQPSSAALAQYYRFLVRAAGSGVRQVVLVGGNHDSASRLDAPAEVLAALDVHVVGGIPGLDAPLDRLLVPLYARGAEQPSAVALAVPYVHEYRLGVRTTDLEHAAVRAAFAEHFGALYARLVALARQRWPRLPIVATGHLTLGSPQREDYPHAIHQVGLVDGLPASVIHPAIQYAALGHIHRPYPVAAPRIWYSGSPVALSLPEAAVSRRVLQVQLHPDPDGQPEVTPVQVPSFRGLVEIEAPPDKLLSQLRGLSWSEPLPPLIYARAVSDEYQPALMSRIHEALEAFPEPDRPALVELRGVRATPLELDEQAEPVDLDTLSPEQVFATLCRAKGLQQDDALAAAFASIARASGRDVETMAKDIREGRA
jgi:exonuclease SbcD